MCSSDLANTNRIEETPAAAARPHVPILSQTHQHYKRKTHCFPSAAPPSPGAPDLIALGADLLHLAGAVIHTLQVQFCDFSHNARLLWDKGMKKAACPMTADVFLRTIPAFPITKRTTLSGWPALLDNRYYNRSGFYFQYPLYGNFSANFTLLFMYQTLYFYFTFSLPRGRKALELCGFFLLCFCLSIV